MRGFEWFRNKNGWFMIVHVLVCKHLKEWHGTYGVPVNISLTGFRRVLKNSGWSRVVFLLNKSGFSSFQFPKFQPSAPLPYSKAICYLEH